MTRESVNNIPEQNIVNRLSKLQRGILSVLPDADAHAIGSGEILRRLDAPVNACTRASVSRALRRLAERGLVLVLVTELCRPGRGYLYRRAA